MTEPMHQTRTPPLVERVQLVGGPLDGEYVFVVPGAPYTVERAVLPPRRDSYWYMFGGPQAQEAWKNPRRKQKKEDAKVQVAVYTYRRTNEEVWVPYLGFDGIVERDLPPDLREKYKDHLDNHDNEDGYEEGF